MLIRCNFFPKRRTGLGVYVSNYIMHTIYIIMYNIFVILGEENDFYFSTLIRLHESLHRRKWIREILTTLITE